MQICLMLYLSASQSRAATYAVPLSVTSSSTAPHLHKISLNMNVPIVRPVSTWSVHHSGQAVSEQQACTMYRNLPVGGMNMVLIYTLQKSGARMLMVGGMQTLVIC